jgi:LPS-assembly protein
MTKLYKINVKTGLAIVVTAYLLILTFYVRASGNHISPVISFVTVTDTVPAKPVIDTSRRDSARRSLGDTSFRNRPDSIQVIDTTNISKDSLEAPVKYHADDSAVIIVSSRDVFLYGKAKTEYQDIKLDAGTIEYRQEKQMVKAYGNTDTTGSLASQPTLVQGDLSSISDTIFYNFKTARALTKNTYLQEGEFFLNAKVLKKINAEEAYAQDARFTTCNLDHPHFAFHTPRLKVVNNKVGVTGRIYPEIESVPVPIISLPFSLIPLSRVPQSGILFPTFTASEDFGLGLEGLGYYSLINDFVDNTTTANLYSYGGWQVTSSSKYIKRYKYSGSLSVSLQKTKLLNRDISSKEEFSQSQNFMVTWGHSRDNRARPGTNFSASVNFGSTKYNQYVYNNPFINYSNRLNSSISYNRDWNGKYNLSMNLNHSQNSNTRLMTLNLPTMNFNVVTMYPFQSADQAGSGKWYEKIGVGYSGNFQNQINFYDTAFSFKQILDTLQWGAVHNVPITLSLPSLGPLMVSPGVTYEERWYGQRIFRRWNDNKNALDTIIQRGFYAARQMSFSLGFNSRIFGTYNFGKSKRLEAIRHEIRPTISMSYQPDFAGKYYYNMKVDTSGRELRFSQFDGSVIGPFSEGQFGGISFGIDNLLEMKVKNRDTSVTDPKNKYRKIKLLDGFGFNSSYNFLADSFALGMFNFYARSTLFEKVNITASALLDPYEADVKGFRVNKLAWDPKHFKFGRITSGSLAISTSFASKTRDGKDASEMDKELPVDPFLTPDEQQRQLQFARSNPAEFTDFNIPWTLSLSYSLSFNRLINPDYSGFRIETYSSFNFNGDFSLSPKWKIGGSGYYDVKTGVMQQMSMFITREMHCWQLSINVTPLGMYRSFSINFSPKAGILRDLKINRTRTFTNSNY